MILTWENQALTEDQVIDDLAQNAEYFRNQQSMAKDLVCHGDITRWYDYEKDMRQLSAQYPDTVFALQIKGEDQDQEEVSYYQNQQSYSTVLELPPFNPDLLA